VPGQRLHLLAVMGCATCGGQRASSRPRPTSPPAPVAT